MTTATFNTTSADLSGNDVVWNPTGTGLVIGGAAAGEAGYKAWFPFTVTLWNSLVITSATLKVRAATSNSSTTCKVKVGCEAADNPSAPTNWTQLNARTLTTAYTTNNNVAAWTAGTEYTFDITTAVQEILNRAGWSYGNTMAVLFQNNGSGISVERQIAAYEHASYSEAILEIVYTLPSGVAVASLSDYGII